jgi:hypothetical protein
VNPPRVGDVSEKLIVEKLAIVDISLNNTAVDEKSGWNEQGLVSRHVTA